VTTYPRPCSSPKPDWSAWTFEHFVRIVVGSAGPPGATLFNLLEIAVFNNLIRLPWDDQKDGIRKVCAARNTILHGNYAQAAREAGKAVGGRVLQDRVRV